MKKFSFLYSLIAVSFLAFSACSASQKTEKKQNPSIKYKKWSLNSIGGVWVDSTTAKTAYVIFNNDGTMGGNSSCNNFGGNYLIAQDTLISFTSVHVTEMACANNVFERPFLDAINKVNKFTVENKQLVLWNNDEKLIVFSPPAR